MVVEAMMLMESRWNLTQNMFGLTDVQSQILMMGALTSHADPVT
jgi:hypothetical protein